VRQVGYLQELKAHLYLVPKVKKERSIPTQPSFQWDLVPLPCLLHGFS